MINKDEIKVDDLVLCILDGSIFKVKRINKQSITTEDGVNIKFTDLVFKITNEDAKQIYLNRLTKEVKNITKDLEKLRDIILEVGNMNDWILFNKDVFEDNINSLLTKIEEGIKDEYKL